MKTYRTAQDEDGRWFAAVTENGVETKTYYPNETLAKAAAARWQANEEGV